jgi:hypothetical protein
VLALLAAALLAQTAPTPTKAPAASWLSVSLRTGYAMPMGWLRAGEPIRDTPANVEDMHTGMVPLWLDAQVWVARTLSVGPSVQAGWTYLRGGCPEGLSCSGRVLRLGVGAEWHPLRGDELDPWLGLGTGYEWASQEFSLGEDRFAFGFRGLELANLQGGADWRMGKSPFQLGLFSTLTFGRYGQVNVEANGRKGEESIRDRATHAWLFVGARVRFAR